MNKEEKEEFKCYVLNCVNKANEDSYKKTVKAYDKHSNDIERILSTILPDVLNSITNKPNYWFPILLNILNGVIIGIAMYLAIIFAI